MGVTSVRNGNNITAGTADAKKTNLKKKKSNWKQKLSCRHKRQAPEW
jgi:hypothetical protein